MEKTYKAEINDKAQDKLKEIIDTLPEYCVTYLNSKNYSLSPRSRLAYAQDLWLFLYYIKANNPKCSSLSIKEIPFEILDSITPMDMDEYMVFLEKYELDGNGQLHHNGPAGKRRKLAAVREMYKSLCKYGLLSHNPAALVDTPKDEIKNKQIRVLDETEKGMLFEALKPGNDADEKKRRLKELLYNRDVAITTLFLGTGIRLSELVGLNLDDVDMKNQVIHVVGKGNKYVPHFFNDEVYTALDMYLTYTRPELKPNNEEAFFLSRLGTRINIRTVEYMVKKVSTKALGKSDSISPHKLRSTYGSDLYAATGDIALVSDNLGHANISTSKQYYVRQNLDNLRKNKEFEIRKQTT